jgi:hypothetical protein
LGVALFASHDVDLYKELAELFGTVAAPTLADYLSCRDIERSKQRRCPIANVRMRLLLGSTGNQAV